jgi:hypothetical protein
MRCKGHKIATVPCRLGLFFKMVSTSCVWAKSRGAQQSNRM